LLKKIKEIENKIENIYKDKKTYLILA